MPELKSMKFADRESSVGEIQPPRFPSIHLSKEQMSALGLTENATIGSEMMLVAKVKLTSMSIGEREFDNRAELDLIEAALEAPERSQEDMAKVLFGSEE